MGGHIEADSVGVWNTNGTDSGVCVGRLCEGSMQLRTNENQVAFVNHRRFREQSLCEVGGDIGGDARKRDKTAVLGNRGIKGAEEDILCDGVSVCKRDSCIAFFCIAHQVMMRSHYSRCSAVFDAFKFGSPSVL